jgi:hypothetical protein
MGASVLRETSPPLKNEGGSRFRQRGAFCNRIQLRSGIAAAILASMSRREKLIARFKGRPKDFTWDELARLLAGLGYVEAATGKTGGSRRRFVHATAPALALHKPHPGNIVKMYVIDDVLRLLIEEGLI